MTDESRARAGAAYLDLRPEAPGWRERIDVDDLDMHAWNTCVLGQLFGSYYDGKKLLRLGMARCTALGFTNVLLSSEDSFVPLTAAWREVILEQPGRPLLPVRAKRQRRMRNRTRPEPIPDRTCSDRPFGADGRRRPNRAIAALASAPAGKDEK